MANGGTQPITDNVPMLATAHTVRHLVCCSVCDGIGDRRLMIEFTNIAEPNDYQHTSCYTKANPKTVHRLSPSNLAKLRLCDLALLADKQKDAVMAAFALNDTESSAGERS